MGSTSCKESRSDSAMSSKGDFVEGVVCNQEDLKDNEMKVFDLGQEQKVLVVKQNGKFSAVGTKCTHYGAPLSSGALGEGRVRCPWHGACFSVTTGDIEDFPGLDSLPCYEVTVNEGLVKVKARKDLLQANKRVKEMATKDKNNNTTFVIVGAGGAGVNCVEVLRQEGFTGRIVMITQEKHLPYDRPKLTKAMDIEISKLTLRNPDFYKQFGIEVMTSTAVEAVDPSAKTIKLNPGGSMKFDSLFIATGGRPRALAIPGSNLQNVFTMRYIEDANQIAKLSREKDVVILGSSFIGMECAAYLVGKAKSITVVGRENVPFKAVLGEEVGGRLKAFFEEKGVKFSMNSALEKLEGEGTVKEVVLSDGTKLPADVCIVGIGVVPNTEFLKGSGIELNSSETVMVDKFLKTNVDGIYAGGDIAAAPLFIYDNKPVSIGHWQLAHYHGKAAAHNMLGQQKEARSVPFFWCMVFGKSIRYAGYGAGFDGVLLTGSLEDLAFVAYYCKGEKVIAVATLNSDPIAAKFAELLTEGKSLTKSEVLKGPSAWIK